MFRIPLFLLLAFTLSLFAPGPAFSKPVLDVNKESLKDETGSFYSEDHPEEDKQGTGKTIKEGDLFQKRLISDNFLKKVGRRTTVGGYGEFVFSKDEDARSQFESRRFIIFLHSEISERISTSTEIEFEKGGSPEKTADGSLSHGEVLLEFSVLDFRLWRDWINFRSGVVLVPFGYLNTNHDSPTQDLTERPIAFTTIVPTTWFEAGLGFFGDIDTGKTGEFNYEIYAINGLDSQIVDGSANRQARGSLGPNDNNSDKGVAGRIGYSPFLGLEAGFSGYTGEYDRDGHRANLIGFDLLYKWRWLEVLGEYVEAFNDAGFVVDGGAGSANLGLAVPTRMRGWYGQTNIHFFPFSRAGLPKDMQDATFTGVVRFEQADTDTSVENANDRTRLTFGLNFRPVEATVFKTDMHFNWNAANPGIEDPRLGFRFSTAFLF